MITKSLIIGSLMGLSTLSLRAESVLPPEIAFPMNLQCKRECLLAITPVYNHYIYDNIQIYAQNKKVPIKIVGNYVVLNDKKSYTFMVVSFSKEKYKEIVVKYQGCKESIFCYAMQEQIFKVK